MRVIRGWSRQQLAEAIRTPEGTLANWERGSARPRLATLDRIVDALSFPPAMLGRTLAFVAVRVRAGAPVHARPSKPPREPAQQLPGLIQGTERGRCVAVPR